MSNDVIAEKLPVMEDFYTIQGEGFHAGRAAYFIRIQGCDVGCVWCDVKESWDIVTDELVSVKSLVDKVIDSGTNYCVITGGEPCMQDLSLLTEKLHKQGIEIGLETSGCYPLIGSIDWYCFSPKKFKEPNNEAYKLANELKVIINHPSDLAWAEDHANKLQNDECLLFLQPEWSKQERYLPLIIDYVKDNPKWRISLQTHKHMNIP